MNLFHLNIFEGVTAFPSISNLVFLQTLYDKGNAISRPAQSAVAGSEATRHISIWQAYLNKIN